MEVEENNCILFLEILLIRKRGGLLAHKGHRKKARADSYLHVNSHHHRAIAPPNLSRCKPFLKFYTENMVFGHMVLKSHGISP